MKNKASNKKILSLLLAVLMVLSILPLTTAAESEEETETGIITAFEAPSEDVAAQSVETGTPSENLNLPDTLSATIDGAAGTVTGVTWESEPEYDSDTAGTYSFTAEISDEYTVEDGAEPPVITVTVEAIGNGELRVENDEDGGSDTHVPDETPAPAEEPSPDVSPSPADEQTDEPTPTLNVMPGLLSMLMPIEIQPFAVDDYFQSTGVWYKVLSESVSNYTVEVTNDEDRNMNYSGSLVIPATVGNGGNTYNVVSIAYNAFSDCTTITSLNLSGATNLTTIGSGAFYCCSGIEGTLVIPSGVTDIGSDAFLGCSKFTELDMSGADNLASIGSGAFRNCSGFTALDMSGASNLRGIGNNAFYNCSGFTGTLTIPSSVTSIGSDAFLGCSKFTELDMSGADNLASIGSDAFYYCSGFTGTLTIPLGVTSIGSDAFLGCGKFTAFVFTGATAPTMASQIRDSSAPSYYPAGAARYDTVTNPGLPTPAYPYNDDSPAVTGSTNQTAAEGGTAAFSVTVLGGTLPYGYRWRVYDSKADANADTDGTGGALVSNGGAYSGANTSTLTVTAGAAVDGKYYKCFVTDSVYPTVSEMAASEEARLSVEYSVTYKDHTGGDITSSLPSAYDGAKSYIGSAGVSAIPDNEPYTRTGYTFDGWYDAQAGGSKVTAIDNTAVGSVTLFARWTANEYTVTYDANGGEGTVSNGTAAYDSAFTFASGGFTRTGYTLMGWSTEAGGTVQYSLGQEINLWQMTSGGLLYAVWTDTTAPTGKIEIKNNSFDSFLSNITFGLFFKNTVDVTITGQDDGSGVDTIKYIKTTTEMNRTELENSSEWTLYSTSFSVNAKEKFVVYAKITDNVGNVTIISSDGVVVYTDSEATVNGGSFSKASTADLAVAVAMSGNTVKSIVSGSNTLTAGTDYTVDYTMDGTITFINAYLKGLADGTQSFIVTWYPLGETGTARTGSDTPGTTTVTVSVSKAAQEALSITGLGSSYTYGGPYFNLSTEGGTGAGAVTYTSSDSAVASVSGDTVTIRKAGSFTITAVKAADGEYNEVSVTSGAVTVSEATPTVTLAGDDMNYGQTVTLNVTVSGAGAVPEGTVTFKEGATILATATLVDGVASYTTTTNPAAGNHTYTAEYYGQIGYYTAATGTKSIGVGMTDQAALSITGSPTTVTYGDSGFTLGTGGGSGTGVVTFSVPNNDVVSITAGGAVTIRGAGMVTVTAEKAGDNNYNPATATITINVLPRDIDSVTVTVTGSTVYTGSQLQPAFTVADGTLAIDTGDYTNTYGENITVAEGGSIILTGQRNYIGTKTVSFTIRGATPAANIFPTAAAVTYDPDQTLADVTLSGGSGDGTFTWQDSTIVPTANNGSYTVVFTPNDEDNYDYSGVTLTKTVALTVSKAEQTLTRLPDLVKVNGGENFEVTPSSNAEAENPNISFQSSKTAVIDFDASGKFVIKGDGMATITVLAATTDNYNSTSATFVIRVLADTADLEDVIGAAEDLIDGLENKDIGNGDGQYPQDAVDELQYAIDKAKDVANNPDATQAEIDQAKEDLLEAINDFQNSLISIDFTALDKAIADGGGGLEKGYYSDTTWDALQTALAAGRTVRSTANVTQAEVDAAAKAINDAISALVNEYRFTTEFGTFTFTGSGDLTAKIDAPYDKFEKLLIDGKELDSANYTVTEGSTIITLKEAYLKTLANGTYEVAAQFTDGTAETTLTVKLSSTSTGSTDNSTGSSTSGTSAKTGDDSTTWLWFALLGVSSLGIAGTALTRKRKLFGWKRK